MSTAKAKIDINEGLIELEGSEAFVTKYLEEYKSILSSLNTQSKQASPSGGSTHKPSTRGSTKKPTASKKKNTGGGKRKGAAKVTPEKFDIHGNSEIPALKDFHEEKKPGKTNGNIIAVIGYYITELLGNEFFTEGQIEYAYKMLKLDRPGHLHQVMINNKNEKDYYEPREGGETGQWVLTRGGDIFVSDELPPSDQ